MSDKNLHNVIRTSMLALVNPQMAEACISADLTAEQFSAVHQHMTGSPVQASTEDSQDDDEAKEMEKLLLSIPGH